MRHYARNYPGCRWLSLGILLMSFLSPIILSGQVIEETVSAIKDRIASDPIVWSGGISGSAQLNSIRGILRRRDLFNLNLYGHLNMNILGIDIPMSLAIADRNTTYRLPSYSFVGLSPTYKWVRLHLFRRNMQFSEYTLNGHGFNGFGFELNPGRFRAMGMVGTLRKSRLEDYGYRQELDPFHKRLGYALKLGYEHQTDRIFVTLFKATDDAQSLIVPDSLGITPQENVVISSEAKKKLSELLTIEGGYAFSIWTPDQRFSNRRPMGFENLVTHLMDINTLSKSSSAYNFGVEFSPVQAWALSLKYERVNPNFISLGTLQFRNDFENISMGYRGKLSKRILMTGRLGMERNNLDHQEIESRNRFIGSFQFNLLASDRLQSSLSYSNFRQTTRLIDNSNPFEPADSIFLGSVNSQFGLGSTYKINQQQRLVVHLTHQRANSIVNEVITQAISVVNNASLSYQLIPLDSKWNGGISFLWNRLVQARVETSAISSVVQLNYKINDTWTSSFTLTNNLTSINQVSNGHILRIGLGSQYSISKKQRLNMQIQILNRTGAIANNFREVNAQLGYSMNF